MCLRPPHSPVTLPGDGRDNPETTVVPDNDATVRPVEWTRLGTDRPGTLDRYLTRTDPGLSDRK